MANGCPKCDPGLPPWLATFADLMSLLMCFFVLLLSFATIDAVRFKKMAESMKDAFGVQREIPANEIVKGVSVIKQEWSPTLGEPSVITEIRQQTSDVEKEHLKMKDGEGEGAGEQQEEIERKKALEAAQRALQEELREQLADLQAALEVEMKQGLVTLEQGDKQIIIRRTHGYHGTNFGGTTAQGIAPNRDGWGDLVPHFIEVPNDNIEEVAKVFAQSCAP